LNCCRGAGIETLANDRREESTDAAARAVLVLRNSLREHFMMPLPDLSRLTEPLIQTHWRWC
jgi:hypothetical protein